MEIKKRLKKWSDGLGIYFTKAEVDTHDMQEGDIIHLVETKLEKKK